MVCQRPRRLWLPPLLSSPLLLLLVGMTLIRSSGGTRALSWKSAAPGFICYRPFGSPSTALWSPYSYAKRQHPPRVTTAKSCICKCDARRFHFAVFIRSAQRLPGPGAGRSNCFCMNHWNKKLVTVGASTCRRRPDFWVTYKLMGNRRLTKHCRVPTRPAPVRRRPPVRRPAPVRRPPPVRRRPPVRRPAPVRRRPPVRRPRPHRPPRRQLPPPPGKRSEGQRAGPPPHTGRYRYRYPVYPGPYRGYPGRHRGYWSPCRRCPGFHRRHPPDAPGRVVHVIHHHGHVPPTPRPPPVQHVHINVHQNQVQNVHASSGSGSGSGSGGSAVAGAANTAAVNVHVNGAGGAAGRGGTVVKNALGSQLVAKAAGTGPRGAPSSAGASQRQISQSRADTRAKPARRPRRRAPPGYGR